MLIFVPRFVCFVGGVLPSFRIYLDFAYCSDLSCGDIGWTVVQGKRIGAGKTKHSKNKCMQQMRLA